MVAALLHVLSVPALGLSLLPLQELPSLYIIPSLDHWNTQTIFSGNNFQYNV
jgi:hypothetical protein